ncbi:MAG: hypothetical protein V4760_17680, partial [Bdellovibrionota bacterium]
MRASVGVRIERLLKSAALALLVVSSLQANAQSVHSVTPREVSDAIETNMVKVKEFVFIRNEAEKLGVKAYLFGGTAAGYAHYVRNDLLRLKGDKRIQAARFDYDFTNIFRSTQDLDVVIDGTSEQIERLSKTLAAKYPHFVGAKATKWELRSLRESKGKAGEPGYKEALLDSADFLNQNSDSNSTGLIELTGKDRDVVLDLRDRTSTPSRFLKDVAAGEITFYRSPKHNTTPRAQAGNNPEVFSVVRALTKAFQYDLVVRYEDWVAMKSIVGAFQSVEIARSTDNKRRLIDMGKKLFLHAVDVERAWNDLESLGLRQKLLVFDSPKAAESLSWWLSKEPLRSKPIGMGSGRTAAEIARERGLEKLYVAHETRSFLALESIERSPKGSPNFFISRNTAPGEAAAFGDGTYTRIGRAGAVGSGLTVRMFVDPNAREGTDFILGGNEYVILRNKSAVTVVNEGFSLTPSQYVEMIANDQSFDRNEKGLIEKMTRRISNQSKNLDASELAKIAALYRDSDQKVRILSELIRLDLPLPISRSELESIINRNLDRLSELKRRYVADLRRGVGGRNPEIVKLAREVVSISSRYEQVTEALLLGFALTSSQASQAHAVFDLQRVGEENFEKLWDLADKSGKLEELRTLLSGTSVLSVYKGRMVERARTSAELQKLGVNFPGEHGSSGPVWQWVNANPVRVMQLKPSDADIQKYFDHVQTSDRAAWAEQAIPHATSAASIVYLLDPRIMKTEVKSEAAIKMSRVAIANAKTLMRLGP